MRIATFNVENLDEGGNPSFAVRAAVFAAAVRTNESRYYLFPGSSWSGTAEYAARCHYPQRTAGRDTL